jgi:hypothetical protein
MALQALWKEVNLQLAQLEVRKRELLKLGDDPAAIAELKQLEMLIDDSYETLDISGYYNPPASADRATEIASVEPAPIQHDAFRP